MAIRTFTALASFFVILRFLYLFFCCALFGFFSIYFRSKLLCIAFVAKRHLPPTKNCIPARSSEGTSIEVKRYSERKIAGGATQNSSHPKRHAYLILYSCRFFFLRSMYRHCWSSSFVCFIFLLCGGAASQKEMLLAL